MNKKWITGSLLFALLLTLFLYMAGFFTPKIALKQQPQMIESTMAQSELATHTMSETIEPVIREFPGLVVANQKATIASRITATVVEVLVEVGTNVKQGDVLLRLESDDLDARVKQMEQSFSSAQAQLNAARAEYVRIKELLQKKLVPQSQYDQAESTLKTASANLEKARAAMSEAETNLGYSVISAPFDGVITQKSIHKGDTATTGSALFSMYNPESLIVEAHVSESSLSVLNVGKSINMQFPTLQTNVVGTIREVAPAADSGSRSYLVRLGFTNKDKLYPGNFVKVGLQVSNQSVLKVPAAAVYQVGQLDYVRVFEKGEFQTRLVQLGEDLRVRKGLKQGDVVLLNPREI